MNFFISSYDKNRTITYYNTDRSGKKRKFEEHLENMPSYIKKYENHLYVAQKKDSSSNSLGIIEYEILKDKIKKKKLYKSLASFTHLFVDKEYIIGASYHQGLVQIFKKNSNKSIIKEFPNSKIHNVGYIDYIKKYYAVDLAGNCIYFFEIVNEKFILSNIIKLEKDDMPRHIWHSSGNSYLYIVTENSSKVKVLNLENKYEFIQEIETIQNKCENNPAAIMADEIGEYIYVSNRGKNDIAIFKVDKNNGKLEYWYDISDLFENPRDLYIMNNILYVASQGTNAVKIYKLDNENKKYTMLQNFEVEKPVCIEV